MVRWLSGLGNFVIGPNPSAMLYYVKFEIVQQKSVYPIRRQLPNVGD